MLYKLALLIIIIITAGCGSESSSTQSQEQNSAPTISVIQTNQFYENELIQLSFTATDSEDDALTFSLSGPDAELFTLDINNSKIYSITEFDYESPSDINSDNQYIFSLVVNDGSVSSKFEIELNLNNIIENNDANLRRNINVGDKLYYKASYKGLETYPTSMSGPGSLSIEYLTYEASEPLNLESGSELFLQKMTFFYDNDKSHSLNEVVFQKPDSSLYSLLHIQSDSQTYCTNYNSSCIGFMIEPSYYSSGSIFTDYLLHNLETESEIVRNIYSTQAQFSFEIGDIVIFNDTNNLSYEVFEVSYSRVFEEPPQAGHLSSLSGKLYIHPSIGIIGGDMKLLTHLDVGSKSSEITFTLNNKNF